jgi:Domain of unknown function (DUF4386)
MIEGIRAMSPRFKARIAGIFYLLNILTAASALAFDSRGLQNYSDSAIFIATLCYLVVTLLFYSLFKPVNKKLSLLAACFSLAGCIPGMLRPLHLAIFQINSIVYFGFYCLLIGYLIFRSTFLPRILGVLMVFGGLGWLTFFFTRLASRLSPFNMIPGILGEGLLTLWLLVRGVNVEHWNQQAGPRYPA